MAEPDVSDSGTRAIARTSPSSHVVIATRQSPLALWQARHVQSMFAERFGVAVELLGMTTRGDEILDRTLSKVGGKGLFVKELETALADGTANLAVHSLKDVPMVLPAGFELAAVLEREDARDALVSRRFSSLAALPPHARVGTSSLRRESQLRQWRPDLRIEPLRGNVNTRLRKLDEGEYDAIVLAAAGLRRLGLWHRVTELLPVDVMIPSGGQGALAIECRSDALRLRSQLASLTHRPTLLAVTAERAVSQALGGSCSMPLAAFAALEGDAMRLRLSLGHWRDTTMPLLKLEASARIRDEFGARRFGEQAALMMKAQGADHYLEGHL